MPNGHAFYKNPQGLELHLYLDIDLKKEQIIDFFYKGTLKENYSEELEELKQLVMNQNINYAQNLKRSDLSSEVPAKNGNASMASLSLWLLHRALDDYKGQSATLIEQNDLLCLCFGVTTSDLKKELLKRPQYDLPDLIKETLATTACGKCKDLVTRSMKDLRDFLGIVPGLGQVPGRKLPDGSWFKIKNLYPAELLFIVDDLINKWLARELQGNELKIEITKIEGYHLWLTFEPAKEESTASSWLLALSEYLQSELGVHLFLHLDVA